MNLSNNTFLQGGKYKIVRFISAGGFGCTYEAEHVMLHKRIAIKEFFVKDFCNRDETTLHVTVGTQSKVALVEKLKRKFIDEAIALSQLSHPNIVTVSDVFIENGTAYYVMDYIEGKSLHQLVNERGTLPETEATAYIKEVAEALDYVHKLNRLHLDIKPGNIMVNVDGHTILIDFGASKQYDEVDGENTSTLLGKTPGYAPIEQMGNRVQTFSAATDIYALGATFYKLVTGETPAEATEIADDEEALKPIPESISSAVRKTIAKAMEVRRKDRQQNIEEFLESLSIESFNSKILEPHQNDDEHTFSYNEIIDVSTSNKITTVDLGLSVKWATCNIGARFDFECGDLFLWPSTKTSQKEFCTEDNICGTEWDYASNICGQEFRMPSESEMRELVNKCLWFWSRKSGTLGYNIIGPNKKTIFLPAAGYLDQYQIEQNAVGYYWTGTSDSPSSAFVLDFDDIKHEVAKRVKYYGRSIRPVMDK